MTGVARVLSKWGICSRTSAALWVKSGRVQVNGRVVRDPERAVDVGRDVVRVDGLEIRPAERITIMLNKPRGLVTTASDEKGRPTIYDCLDDVSLPWLAPVGRLDRASEGLLLMTNDPEFAATVTDPDAGPPKVYHVQVTPKPDAGLPTILRRGVVDKGEALRAAHATILREGRRSGWLEIVLHEGRNRQIRRMLTAAGHRVDRLVRIAIGGLELGALAKGRWRRLDAADLEALRQDVFPSLVRGASEAAMRRARNASGAS